MAESILERIVAQRQQALSQLFAEVDFDALRAQLTPSQRSLKQALLRDGAQFILECKKASPSKGLIRPDFNAVAIAKEYEPFAAAISVLTEPDFFQGDWRYLAAVSASVQVPVLCKDFIVTPEQAIYARAHGADALLLMLSVLDDNKYLAIAKVADELGMDILTEVSNTEEMQRATNLNADVIGINHRNLHDLSIDPNRSAELAPMAPKKAVLVAESGFTTYHDVQRVAPHVHGFLVGSALTAQTSITQACRALIYGSHKVCGLTSGTDAQVAAAHGASYGGLIFAKRSARAVDLKQALAITTSEPSLAYVAVVSDQPLAEVVELTQQLPLAAVQLHGHEDIDYVQSLRKQLPADVEIWQALNVDQPVQLPNTGADRFVLDQGRGGTGKTFDWRYLDTLTAEQRKRCILAGGLNISNLKQAQATQLPQFDFNSGVEAAPGRKDAFKIRQIFTALRG